MYKRVTFVTLVFLLVGVFMIVAAKRMDNNGIVLRIPLGQRPDSATHPFTVPITGQYRVGVECTRNLPFETLKLSLQQGNLVDVELRRGAALVKLNYFPQPQLSQNTDSSAQLGNLKFSNHAMGQDIAYFNGSPGEKYEVSFTIIRPLDALNGTNPALIVYLDPQQYIARGFVSTAMVVTGYTLLALGAALFIYRFLFART